MSDPNTPWSGRADDAPSHPDHRPGAEPTTQPQYEFATASGPHPPYGGHAGPQGQYSGPPPQYGYPAYGNVPFPGDEPAKKRNTLGIIALVVAILGAIMSVVPGAAIIGWILLPFGFIMGLVGLFASGKPKGSAIAAVIVSILGTIMAMAFFVTVIGDAFDSAFDDPVAVSRSDSGDTGGSGGSGGEVAAVAGDSGDDVGTRDNPAAIGDVLGTGDWKVVVNSFTRNATDQVMAANMFNDLPPAGSQYALVNLTATYVGDESGYADFLSVSFVTDGGNVIRSFDNIAVTPEPLEGELYPGASATGNVSLAIPEVESGLLRLELSMFGGEVFVAVE